MTDEQKQKMATEIANDTYIPPEGLQREGAIELVIAGLNARDEEVAGLQRALTTAALIVANKEVTAARLAHLRQTLEALQHTSKKEVNE